MTAVSDLSAFEWPRARVSEALAALARAVGRPSPSADPKQAGSVPPVPASAPSHTLGEAVVSRAATMGLDLETSDLPARDPIDILRGLIPALVHVNNRAGLLIVLRVSSRRATLIGPLGTADVPTSWLDQTLVASAGGEAANRVSAALGQVELIPPARRARISGLLLAPSLTGRPVAVAWNVRRPSVGLAEGLRGVRVYRRAAGLLVGYLLQFALFLLLWRQIGARGFSETSQPAPGGYSNDGWPAFLTVLAMWAVVQLLVSSAVSRLALDIGQVVRATLLRGALHLDPEHMRTAGVGQLLGRALEAEALDSLALGGGVDAAAGSFELLLGAIVLGLGVAPAWSLLVLGATFAALAVLAGRYTRHLRKWGHTRRELTHDLVERMVGHRTALIQDRPGQRAHLDDEALASYDADTRALDRVEIMLGVALPRLWLLCGLAVLSPAIFSTRVIHAASLAVAVAGVWLIYGAFRRLGYAFPLLALAREAWGQISPLIAHDSPPETPATTDSADAGDSDRDDRLAVPPLLVARKMSYRYPERSSPVLAAVDLEVAAGERVLLEGVSGGGKSTLAALLTGLRVPTSGRLLLRGISQQTIGLARWRAAVGAVPQFHDNHILGTDLLFNLLMGRRWPPRLEDVAIAEKICRDLGLGGLLDRMPSGLQQQVGETGWQLSHGERGRVFIARSLLQTLDARVLDESFAALDPETLDHVMDVVLARPEALIVIAHP